MLCEILPRKVPQLLKPLNQWSWHTALFLGSRHIFASHLCNCQEAG